MMGARLEVDVEGRPSRGAGGGVESNGFGVRLAGSPEIPGGEATMAIAVNMIPRVVGVGSMRLRQFQSSPHEAVIGHS